MGAESMTGGLFGPQGGQGVPAAPGPQGPQGNEPQMAGLGEEIEATPEEQAQYESIMDNAFKLIYTENVFPKVLTAIQKAETPVEGVASVVATTIGRVQSHAKQKGVELAGDVLYQAGADLVADVSETVEKAGIADMPEQDVEAAHYRALDIYMENARAHGEVNMDAMAADAAALQAAEKSGELDAIFNGLGRSNG